MKNAEVAFPQARGKATRDHNTEWIDHVKVFIFDYPDRDHPGGAADPPHLADLPLDTFISGGETSCSSGATRDGSS
jgi:hypothetical protein